MKKFCIFCGQRPEGKNKEHVIPLWLIERTGDPKRIAWFGVDFEQTPPKPRQFSFDSFTFPACFKCNSDFSKLESAARLVVDSLLNHEALSQADFSILLDWLDKVRVGLWLGRLYLDRNPLGIWPKYHIATRIGHFDRTVGIIRIKGRQPGINFLGTESPSFQGSPTCFALLINDLCLLNTSGISTCSRRLGLPYARPEHLRDDGKVEIAIEAGTGRIMRPVQKDLVFPDVVLLHQPIFRNCFIDEQAKTIFDTDSIRQHSLDWARGYGAIFVEKGDSVYKYPDGRTRDWLPDHSWGLQDTYSRLLPFIYRRLIRDIRGGAKISGTERRRRMLQAAALFTQIHNAILRNLHLWRNR